MIVCSGGNRRGEPPAIPCVSGENGRKTFVVVVFCLFISTVLYFRLR